MTIQDLIREAVWRRGKLKLTPMQKGGGSGVVLKDDQMKSYTSNGAF